MALTESQALTILRRELAAAGSSPWVPVGIGDDAAVLAPRGERLVWTTDACNEGAHFRFGWLSPEELAHKSFHSAVSDVAAMGARLRSVNCQLALSPRVTANYLTRFAREQAAQCLRHGAVVSGGNVTMGNEVGVVVSVLGSLPGRAPAALRREGAQPGDELWLVGQLGLAHVGWRLLESGVSRSRRSALRTCLAAFRRPEAQLKAGLRLHGRAHAALDVSDGLLRDAQNLSLASQVALRIDLPLLERTVSQELVVAAESLGLDPRAVAIIGGEDYALLCAGPADRRPRAARPIGQVTSGKGVTLGCVSAGAAGEISRGLQAVSGGRPMRPRGADLVLRGGFQHR